VCGGGVCVCVCGVQIYSGFMHGFMQRKRLTQWRASVRELAARRARAVAALQLWAASRCSPSAYSDQKSANRETRVWHFVIENGY
jgi:heterodisulfide reductase subunit A-like polyferredoxin